MKTPLVVLCAAACSTSFWLTPVSAILASTERGFLAADDVTAYDASQARRAPAALKAKFLPLAKVMAEQKAAKDAFMAALARANLLKKDGINPMTDPFLMATINNLKSQLMQARASKSTGLQEQIMEHLKELEAAFKMPSTTAPPAAAPAPVPVPAPAPAPMPMPVTPPPIPPCNWTYDWEGVARPASCTNMSDGNHTCLRSANLTFSPEELAGTSQECYAPNVSRCERPDKNLILPTEWDFTPLYALTGGDMDDTSIAHGSEFEIICSEKGTALDHRYPLESWGQDWYPGTKKVTAMCNNGTILRVDPTPMTHFLGHPGYKPAGIKPKDLRCVLKEKVDLTQDIVSYLRWTEPRLNEAETKGYKWIDMMALVHMSLLKDAVTKSDKIEKDAREDGVLAEVDHLKRVRQALIDNRMLPRGEPISQEVCKDLEQHWLYQLKNPDPFKKANNIGYANWAPPVNRTIGFPLAKDIPLKKAVDFTCSYTVQKTAAGADPYTRIMNYRYRDGCFCESRWIGGCPFRAELSPSFKQFGFDAIETKGVSTAVGAPTNALCWYFSKPDNPEWGYLGSKKGYSFQAPAANVTELKRDWIKLRKLAQAARFKKKLL